MGVAHDPLALALLDAAGGEASARYPAAAEVLPEVPDPRAGDRFVVDETMLLERTERMGGALLDPLKTTNVQQQRCMTTWVLSKN